MTLRKTGIASSSFPQFISKTGFIIKTPTSTRAGAVAMSGITERRGDTNINGKNNRPAMTATRPVRPPSSTPVADSMKLVVGLVPNIPERIVPVESTIIDSLILRGSPDASKRLPASATPIKVAIVSNKSVKKKVKMTGNKASLRDPKMSSLKNRLKKSGKKYMWMFTNTRVGAAAYSWVMARVVAGQRSDSWLFASLRRIKHMWLFVRATMAGDSKMYLFGGVVLGGRRYMYLFVKTKEDPSHHPVIVAKAAAWLSQAQWAQQLHGGHNS